MVLKRDAHEVVEALVLAPFERGPHAAFETRR